MKRKKNYAMLLGFCAMIAICGGYSDARICPPNGRGEGPIPTVGLYTFSPSPIGDYAFWKACGYNTYQLLDAGQSVPPDQRRRYYRTLRAAIATAKRAGLRVGVLFLSNVDYSPAAINYIPLGDKQRIDHRISEIEDAVKALPNADFFTFFGGDPGGSPDSLGAAGVSVWKDMAKEVGEIVNREAPHAFYNVSLWAVAHFDYLQISPFQVDFWDREVDYSKSLLQETGFLRPGDGVEFPLHNYYRSLALKAYHDAGRRPERYPTDLETKALKAGGISRNWAWTYFLVDEIDDGYTGYSGIKKHPSQAETRYIHQVVSEARAAGINGMIANTEGEGTSIEALNLYAYARCCADASLTPEIVIDEFAGFYTDDKASKEKLVHAIRFIENNSTWEASIPEAHRLPKLACRFADVDEALRAVDQIKPSTATTFPLPEPAAAYLTRLKDRLQDIKG